MKGNQRILLIEDDLTIALIIQEALTDLDYEIIHAASISERNQSLARFIPDLIITDVVLPDGDGIETLPNEIRQSSVPIIILSAQNNLDMAVRAAHVGSYDYLPKPFDLDELTASVQAALNQQSKAPAPPDDQNSADSHGLVGRAPAMQAVYRTIARLATNDLAVLILGESGTGKEVVARAIHSTGLRRQGPFVAINMAAIPRDLIEAELFGHEKGAFTGAHSRNAGRFEQASGGTLFLDEIGDMPLDAQTRLLRVLQSNEYQSVGGHQILKADVRIIAATHRDMPHLISEGRFREDLFYRLNVIPVSLPPLRERRSDIPALVRHFVEGGRASGLPPKEFSAAALSLMEKYDWPGNVRELANLVQRLAVLTRDVVINQNDVQQLLRQSVDQPVDCSPTEGVVRAVELWAAEQLQQTDHQGHLHERLEALVESTLLRHMLLHVNGNQLEAARRLGINRNTLRKKMNQFHIDPVAL